MLRRPAPGIQIFLFAPAGVVCAWRGVPPRGPGPNLAVGLQTLTVPAVICCCCRNRFLSLQRGTCYGLVVQHCQREAAGYGLVVQHCKHDCSASARRTCTAVARSPAHPLFRLVVTFTSLTYYSSKSRQGISRGAREHLLKVDMSVLSLLRVQGVIQEHQTFTRTHAGTATTGAP